MTLGNSPSRVTVLTLEARKSFAFGVTFTDAATGLPIDLTGATVHFALAADYTGSTLAVDRDATVLDAMAGSVQVEIQAADLDLAEGEYAFALTWTNADGYSTLVDKGIVDLRENVDQAVANTYTGVSPSTQLAVSVAAGNQITVEVANLGIGPTGPEGPRGLQGIQGIQGIQGVPGRDGLIQSIQAGANVTVDSTDPANPVVSASGGSDKVVLLEAGQTVAAYEAANGVTVPVGAVVFEKA